MHVQFVVLQNVGHIGIHAVRIPLIRFVLSSSLFVTTVVCLPITIIHNINKTTT